MKVNVCPSVRIPEPRSEADSVESPRVTVPVEVKRSVVPDVELTSSLKADPEAKVSEPVPSVPTLAPGAMVAPEATSTLPAMVPKPPSVPRFTSTSPATAPLRSRVPFVA